MREFIRFEGGVIHIKVHVYLFRDNDCIISYCPSLDLSGCGYDDDEAKKSFEVVIGEYLDYCIKNNTLKRDLANHGWKFEEDAVKEPPFITLYNKNDELKDVVDNMDFTRYSVNQEIPALA